MLTKEQALQILKRCVNGHTHKDYKRVTKLAEKYKILITGEDMEKLLKRFNPREDMKMFEQRKRLTQSITPAVSDKIMSPFDKVSRLDNVDIRINHESESTQSSLRGYVDSFYGEEDLESFMDTRFKELSFCDPNAWIVVELDSDETEEKYYPLEVSSAEAVDFMYKKNRLEYLCVKQSIDYVTAEGKRKEGKSFTIYLKDFQFRITQVQKPQSTASNELSSLSTETESGTVIGIGNQYFMYEIFEPNLSHVQAKRVGYKTDLATDSRTFVNPFHSSLPRFMKTIKSVSELDLTMSLHTFPQKIQYVQPCSGEKNKPCIGGKTPSGDICSSCSGSGVISHTSSQDTIDVPMPKDAQDMYDLEKLVAYKNPPIDLVKFQDEYTDKLEDEALKDVFSTDVFIKTGLENTATGKIISMDSVYDTIQPYSSQYSKTYMFIVETIAEFEDIDDANIHHQFPKDFKMKTVDILLEDLKKANESNAPNFVKVQIMKDIAEKVWQDNPRELLKHKVKSEHMPFLGKSKEDIQYIITSGLTTKEDSVLWSEFDRIFTEIEISEFEKNKDFYKLSFDERKKLIDEKVKEFVEKISTQQSPPNLFPSDNSLEEE